jgi:hypothetical protein
MPVYHFRNDRRVNVEPRRCLKDNDRAVTGDVGVLEVTAESFEATLLSWE